MKKDNYCEDGVWKRIWAKGLIVECPLKIQLEDCPLKEVRKLPIEERIDIVDKMPLAELDAIVEHHKACQAKRMDI